MAKDKVAKEKGLSISDTLKSIQKKFGSESVMMLNQKPKNIAALTTGSMGLDHALGIGGFPRGRIIEIYGAEQSGKTTLALQTIAEAQKLGHVCAFVDAEQALDLDYAVKLGVKKDELIFSQPNGGEEALQITDALVQSGKVALVVIDSVAALTPKAEMEGQIGEQSVGAQARLMSQACRMLIPAMSKTNTVVLFINQIRMNIGGYGNPETTSGGKALKFYSSVRVDVRKIATIKKGDDSVGARVRAKVVKNKVAPPFKQTEYDIVFGEGISKQGELLALGENMGIVAKNSTGTYTFGEEKLGRGYDAARTYLIENPETEQKIVDSITAHWKEGVK